MKKEIIAIVLACITMLALTACGPSDSEALHHLNAGNAIDVSDISDAGTPHHLNAGN